jgi:hypothetical protein
MPTAKTETYEVRSALDNTKDLIKADSYEFDPTTGRHIFKLGDKLVANLLNVSVKMQQD